MNAHNDLYTLLDFLLRFCVVLLASQIIRLIALILRLTQPNNAGYNNPPSPTQPNPSPKAQTDKLVWLIAPLLRTPQDQKAFIDGFLHLSPFNKLVDKLSYGLSAQDFARQMIRKFLDHGGSNNDHPLRCMADYTRKYEFGEDKAAIIEQLCEDLITYENALTQQRLNSLKITVSVTMVIILSLATAIKVIGDNAPTEPAPNQSEGSSAILVEEFSLESTVEPTAEALTTPFIDAQQPLEVIPPTPDGQRVIVVPSITPMPAATIISLPTYTSTSIVLEVIKTSTAVYPVSSATPTYTLTPILIMTNTPPPISSPESTSTPLPTWTNIPPTLIPTYSETPSATATLTETPTIMLPTMTPTIATATSMPNHIHIEFVNPIIEGTVITDLEATNFSAIAYDTRISTQNGAGIAVVSFQIYRWEDLDKPDAPPVYQTNEYITLYCAFGGDSRCGNLGENNSTLPLSIYNGPYVICAQAFAPSGESSQLLCISFMLQLSPEATSTVIVNQTPSPTIVMPTLIVSPSPTPSFTPTMTYTPSASPTMTSTQTPTWTPSPTGSPTAGFETTPGS